MIYRVMKDLLNGSAQLNQLEISAVANMLTLALGQNSESCLPRQNFMAASEIPYFGPVLKENLCIMLCANPKMHQNMLIKSKLVD